MQRTPAETLPSEHQGAVTGPISVAGQELTLYTESPPLVEAMLADIRQAKSRVWFETYIFANDAAGRAVAQALAERANAGCDVRLLVDAWGSFATPNALFDRLRAAGVKVHRFHAFLEAFYGVSFLQVLNQRDHRKLLVVDERIAYFGGMNVVDQSGLESKADVQRGACPSRPAGATYTCGWQGRSRRRWPRCSTDCGIAYTIGHLAVANRTGRPRTSWWRRRTRSSFSIPARW